MNWGGGQAQVLTLALTLTPTLTLTLTPTLTRTLTPTLTLIQVDGVFGEQAAFEKFFPEDATVFEYTFSLTKHNWSTWMDTITKEDQVIEASADCPQPAQPAAAVPEHGIQRAAGLEAPGQRQRTRASGQDHPQQGTDPHPEQRCEHTIHSIF